MVDGMYVTDDTIHLLEMPPNFGVEGGYGS
jgi:hypothetical protein